MQLGTERNKITYLVSIIWITDFDVSTLRVPIESEEKPTFSESNVSDFPKLSRSPPWGGSIPIEIPTVVATCSLVCGDGCSFRRQMKHPSREGTRIGNKFSLHQVCWDSRMGFFLQITEWNTIRKSLTIKLQQKNKTTIRFLISEANQFMRTHLSCKEK